MATAQDILSKLGGPAKAARVTGVPLTTVIGWRDRNFIPEWRRSAIVDAAQESGVSLTHSDFPPRPARSVQSAAA